MDASTPLELWHKKTPLVTRDVLSIYATWKCILCMDPLKDLLVLVLGGIVPPLQLQWYQ